jgi:hypothetical protein
MHSRPRSGRIGRPLNLDVRHRLLGVTGLLPEYQRSFTLTGVPGLLLCGFANLVFTSGNVGVAALLMALGVALCVVAVSLYAIGKGYSRYWGVLGLLWIGGFIVLFFFPDRYRHLSKGSRK